MQDEHMILWQQLNRTGGTSFSLRSLYKGGESSSGDRAQIQQDCSDIIKITDLMDNNGAMQIQKTVVGTRREFIYLKRLCSGQMSTLINDLHSPNWER